MMVLQRPGSSWEEWNEKMRNRWLHTHIARKPAVCSCPNFRVLPTKAGVDPFLSRVVRCVCRECGYFLAVSHENWSLIPHDRLFPPRHPLPIPQYTQEEKDLQQLVSLIEQRGPKDSLFRAYYEQMGGNLDQGEDAFRVLLGMEIMAYPAVADRAYHLYQAFQRREQEDHKDYNNEQALVVSNYAFECDEQDIPLFARIGPPQEVYTAADMPYLMMIPSSSWYCDRWAEIFFAEETMLMPMYPIPSQRLAQFQETLKLHYRMVEEPRRRRWGGRYYWTCQINLFP